MGDLGAFSIDVTRARALLKNRSPAKASHGASVTAKISPVRAPTLPLRAIAITARGFTPTTPWSRIPAPTTGLLPSSAAPVPKPPLTRRCQKAGVGHAEHGEGNLLEPESGHDFPERQLQQQLARRELQPQLQHEQNTHDSDEDGNEVTNDNQFSLSVSVPLDRWMHNTRPRTT